jgi:beta-lactamase regulating signal transducer with metallopeptidase domain
MRTQKEYEEYERKTIKAHKEELARKRSMIAKQGKEDSPISIGGFRPCV